METNISTLQSVPDSMLSKMFDHENPAPIKDGAYLIDADPEVFKVILNWLRHRKVMLVPAVGPVEDVLASAEYFGLYDLVEEISGVETKLMKNYIGVTL